MSRSDQLRARDRAHVWHPFTPHTVWADEDAPVIERGEGCDLIDVDGKRYIDGNSSLWVNVHGHSHPRIVSAIAEQAARLQHATFLGLTHEPGIRLAERLVALAPGSLDRVFFSENGAAAVEVALKMAYSYWRNRGEDRSRFVRLTDAYHGDTLGAVSVGGIERFHETYRPLLFPTAAAPNFYCYRCPLAKTYPSCAVACAEELDAVLTREGSNVAAVVVEPLVQGAAGIITAPDGYLSRAAEIARAHGTLLIVDEIATGFGRTGTMFACEAEGVEPDLMTVGKGVTGGYLPLSATLATEAIFEAFLGRPRGAPHAVPRPFLLGEPDHVRGRPGEPRRVRVRAHTRATATEDRGVHALVEAARRPPPRRGSATAWLHGRHRVGRRPADEAAVPGVGADGRARLRCRASPRRDHPAAR